MCTLPNPDSQRHPNWFFRSSLGAEKKLLLAIFFTILVVAVWSCFLPFTSGNMATGGHGIVISVLAFVIVCNLCPSSETFSDDKRCLNILSEESCDVVTIGYGRNIIFSLLHLHSSRSSISKHHSNAGKFVILLCLLLSGDIHPCPGPNGEVFPGLKQRSSFGFWIILGWTEHCCCTSTSVMQWQGSKY